MNISRKEITLSENEVKLHVGDWLSELGFKVFDEKKNTKRPQWGTFKVTNINRGKRLDLVIQGCLSAAKKRKSGAYVAIEIKCGYKHRDILDGFDAILDYFSDYLWGAEYNIENKRIQISAFVYATFFSKQGFLFKEEGKFDPHRIVKGPWDAYPMTFTISRLLWRQKDNLVKRFHMLSGIPRVERKIDDKICAVREIPEIGVLIKHPTEKDKVRLMLSQNPYHWKFKFERKY